MVVKHEIPEWLFKGILWVILGGLFLISMFSAIFLFSNYTDKLEYKPLFIGMGIMWELILSVVIILIKNQIQQLKISRNNKETGFGITKLVVLGLVYLSMASIPFLGNIGFNKANIEHQSKVIESLNIDNSESDRTEAKSQYTYHKGLRDDYNLKAKNNSADVWEATRWTDLASKEEGLMQAEKTKIDTFKAKPVVVTSDLEAQNIFKNIGSFLHTDPENVKNYIFFIISIIFLAAAGIATPTVKTKTNAVSINRQKLMRYIDALFEVTGKRLNNDLIIMEATDLSENECKEFRKFLLEQAPYNNETLIVSRQGGTSSPFNKETFKTIIRVRLNSQE